MSVEKVKAYLERFGRDGDVLEFEISSATVALAAQAVGVIPARIAKTLSFARGEGCILVAAAGDARIDNARFKAQFGMKARMLTPEDALRLTGHAVGGVCPFAIENGQAEVYLDVSLRRFDTVYPAAGSSNSAIELTCDELQEYAKSSAWVDVCKGWREEEQAQ
ncbi:MAG: YbaK/EbsC family protein [Acetanaerobacterium sp.]